MDWIGDFYKTDIVVSGVREHFPMGMKDAADGAKR